MCQGSHQLVKHRDLHRVVSKSNSEGKNNTSRSVGVSRKREGWRLSEHATFERAALSSRTPVSFKTVVLNQEH